MTIVSCFSSIPLSRTKLCGLGWFAFLIEVREGVLPVNFTPLLSPDPFKRHKAFSRGHFSGKSMFHDSTRIKGTWTPVRLNSKKTSKNRLKFENHFQKISWNEWTINCSELVFCLSVCLPRRTLQPPHGVLPPCVAWPSGCAGGRPDRQVLVYH